MGMVVVVLKMVRGDGWGRQTFEEGKFITLNCQLRAWKYDILQNDQGVTPELAVLFLNCSFFDDCTIYCRGHVTFVLLVRVRIESICTGNSSLSRLSRHVFLCPIAYTKFACKSDQIHSWQMYFNIALSEGFMNYSKQEPWPPQALILWFPIEPFLGFPMLQYNEGSAVYWTTGMGNQNKNIWKSS